MPQRKTIQRGKSLSHNGKPKYQPLPDLSPDEFAVRKADIAENGLQYPVIQGENGNILDGHQRERAERELGNENYPVKIVAGSPHGREFHDELADLGEFAKGVLAEGGLFISFCPVLS
jgi:hypothetical protein